MVGAAVGRRLVYVCIGVIGICYGAAFFYLSFLDAAVADLDGRPQYRFPIHGGDSIGYLIATDNLLERGAFSLRKEAPFEPDAFRTPGFPAFAAALKGVFGGYGAVSAAQVLLIFIAAFLLFRIGERIHSRGIGFFAAAVFLLDPSTIFYSFTVLSDALFVFLLVAAVYLLFFSRWERAWARYAAAGAALGAAVLVRPIGIFLPILFAAAYAAMRARESGRAEMLRAAGVFIAAGAIIFVPWMARNKILFDTWNLSSVGAVTLYQYWLPEYLAERRGDAVGAVQDGLRRAVSPADDYEYRSFRYAAHFQAEFFKNVSEDPFGYVRFHLAKTIPFFVTSSAKNVAASVAPLRRYAFGERGAPDAENLATLLVRGEFGKFFSKLKAQGIFTVEQLWWAAVAFFAALALVLEKERRKYVLLFAGIVLYFALLTGPVSNARYRLPAEPFLLLTAALGFAEAVLRVRRLRATVAEKSEA